MKKRVEKLKVLSLVLAFGLMLTGCGGSSYEAAATTEAAAPAEAYDTGGGYLSDDIYNYKTESTEVAVEEVVEEESGAAESPEVQDVQRKLIKNVNLDVETETLDDLLKTVEEKTERLAGYIEESYTYNGSSYYGGGTRNASMTIRIPSERLEEFLSSISEVSNVISRNDSVTDVTLQYVDLESHKEALLTEQTRLLELLEQAENVEDIITIESRLSEVRYQLESMESQLRTLDNQVSYSTVYLYINEVEKLTPVKEQSIGEKISTGFVNSLWNVGNGLVDLGIGLIIYLPYIVLWAVTIVIMILLIKLGIKLEKKAKVRKQEKQLQKEEKKRQKEEKKQEAEDKNKNE